MKGLRKMVLGIALVVFVFSWTSGVAAATNGQNWVKQDEVTKTYTYDGHTLGAFYAVQGSPDAEPDTVLYNYLYPTYYHEYSVHPVQPTMYIIVKYVSKSRPQVPSTLTITSFYNKVGSDWSLNVHGFYYWYSPYIEVKKYNYFYNESTLTADPQWYIEYTLADRYINGSSESGSSKSYEDLGLGLEAAFDAVLELAGIPLPLGSAVSFMFNVLEATQRQPSPVVKGLGKDNLTVSLKTSPFGVPYYPNYGIILDNIFFYGADNWARVHSVNYMDQIDFDARYAVKTGYYLQVSNSYGLGTTIIKSVNDFPTMSNVNVVIVLTK